MFIIPVDSRYSRGRWPLVTLLLVLVNSLVFFALAGSDLRHQKQAFDYYLESELPEIEGEHYLEYLNRQDRGVERKALADADRDERVAAMQMDGDFQRALREGKIVRRNDPQYADWQTQRARFDAEIDQLSHVRYGFTPAEPSVFTAFTHMFMHGGFGHLFGNMLVLVLVGMLVEYALGAGLYLGVYLLGGLAAVSAFWLVNGGAAIPLVGASGAIAAIMGAFAALYGWHQVRFFYTVVFYFDFVLLPAIVLLPYWLGWEVLQHFLSHDPVAYEAHAGGLAAGALLGGIVRWRRREKTEEQLDHVDRDAQWDQRLQEAQALMGKLEFERARLVFERLHADKPEDLRPLTQLFRLAKSQPQAPAFHRYATALIERRMAAPDELFDEYCAAGVQPQLPAALMLRLLSRYAAAADTPRAERVLGALLRAGSRDPQIAQALHALATRAPPEKARAYRALVARHFPG